MDHNLRTFNNLPFSYAKKYGVFLQPDSPERPVICHKAQLPLMVYSELRRKFRGNFSTHLLNDEQFEAQLAAAYERDSSEAMQMVENLGEEIDLASIAEAVPETEDLLEQEGDAPIIRLINAVLAEAVKENASDIHIESFEKRLVIRFRVDGVLR